MTASFFYMAYVACRSLVSKSAVSHLFVLKYFQQSVLNLLVSLHYFFYTGTSFDILVHPLTRGSIITRAKVGL